MVWRIGGGGGGGLRDSPESEASLDQELSEVRGLVEDAAVKSLKPCHLPTQCDWQLECHVMPPRGCVPRRPQGASKRDRER
jgi:hypothetical protein